MQVFYLIFLVTARYIATPLRVYKLLWLTKGTYKHIAVAVKEKNPLWAIENTTQTTILPYPHQVGLGGPEHYFVVFFPLI